MHSLITSYLLQSRECILPGIGVFKMIGTRASTDTAGNRILPPFETIIFKNEDGSQSPGLVKYIAEQKHITENEANDLLNDFCNEWKDKIDEGERLNFETIGSIQKNAAGSIIFEKETAFAFLQPIPVDSVYQRTNSSEDPVINETPAAPVIIDEKEPQEVIVERSYWGLWALILLAIGLVMLFYHYKGWNLTGSSVGNQHHYTVDSAGATYHLPK